MQPTICYGQPSILFFDLEVGKPLALCSLLITIHMVLLFAGLSALFNIFLLRWRVGHDAVQVFG